MCIIYINLFPDKLILSLELIASISLCEGENGRFPAACCGDKAAIVTRRTDVLAMGDDFTPAVGSGWNDELRQGVYRTWRFQASVRTCLCCHHGPGIGVLR